MTTKQKEIQVSIKDLLEAGVHFGHQTHRWNPKMARFIFEKRNGIHIIDLAKTMFHIRKACQIVQKTVEGHKGILFVGTKKQAKSVIQDCADESGEFYISERWLGGMLTNYSTIRQSVKKLQQIEKKVSQGRDGVTKKELSVLGKQQEKLDRNLSGIRAMRKLPGLVIIVDPSKEHLAVSEARRLGIPVMAIVDTNCDPDKVDFVIPGNDDALKSIKILLSSIKQTIIETKNASGISLTREEEEEKKEKVKGVSNKKEAPLEKKAAKQEETKEFSNE